MVAKRSLRSSEPFPHAALQYTVRPCPLCGRPVLPGPSSDEHHLVPRSQGGRDKTLIHRVCHRKIHATLSEKDLARHYASWDALRAHPEIDSFVRWVANKPPTFDDRSARPRARNRA